MIISDANSIAIGSNLANRAYLGSTLVWVRLIQDWINRINSIGGVLPTPAVQDACINLLITLNSLGITSKILRLNLFCGGDWKASLVPLIVKSGVGLGYDYNGIYAPNSTTQGPFGASDWSLTTGFNASSNATYQSGGSVVGNTNSNTLKIIDTTVPNNISAMANYSVHFANYIAATSSAGTININTYIGVSTVSVQNYTFQPAYTGNTGSTSRFNCYTQNSSSTAGGTLVTNYTSPLGFHVGTRTSATYASISKNATFQAFRSGSYNPNTNTSTAPSLDYGTFMVFGRGSGSSTTPNYGVSKVIANVTDIGMYMYSIGTGLTETDVANYYSAIQAFNTAIGRTNY
jgi:hypothetical protein